MRYLAPRATGERPPCSVTTAAPGSGRPAARARRGAVRREPSASGAAGIVRSAARIAASAETTCSRAGILRQRIRTMRLRHVYGIRGTRVITVDEPAAIQLVRSRASDSFASGHADLEEPTHMPLGDPRLLVRHLTALSRRFFVRLLVPHPGADRRGHGRGGVPRHLQLRDRPHQRDQLARGGPGPRGQRPPRRLEPARPGRALRLRRRPGGRAPPR